MLTIALLGLGVPARRTALDDSLQASGLLAASTSTVGLAATTSTVRCVFMMMDEDSFPTTGAGASAKATGFEYGTCTPPGSNTTYILDDDDQTEKLNDGDLVDLTISTDSSDPDASANPPPTYTTQGLKKHHVVSKKVVTSGATRKAARRARMGVELSTTGVEEMDILMVCSPLPTLLRRNVAARASGGDGGGSEGGGGEDGEGGEIGGGEDGEGGEIGGLRGRGR